MMIRTRLHCAALALVIAVSASALLLGRSFLTPSASAQTVLKSIIVELSGDPVVVAQARAQAAGQSFNADAYRRFLADPAARSVRLAGVE